MSPFRGITLKLLSVCTLMAMASFIKAASVEVPPGQAVFFRSLFAIPVIVGWLIIKRELHRGLIVKHRGMHVWRGIVGTTAMGLSFAGLGLLPLPEVTAIGYAAPILVVVFAAIFLGENVRLFRYSMVAVGMVGVLIVLSPRLDLDAASATPAETLGALLVLLGAVGAALAQVIIRKMTETETTTAIVFYFTLTSTCLSLLTLPWGWVWPSPQVMGFLIMAGLMGGLTQILLTAAFRAADASLIAPFDYASMLLSIAIGYVFFQESPTVPTLLGATLIVAAGIVIILRERALGLKRARAARSVGHHT